MPHASPRSRVFAWRLLAVALALLLPAVRLSAHPMPQSAVLLDFRGHAVGAELRLPLDRLEVGFGHRLADDPRREVAALRPALAAYIAARVSATSPDGRLWRVEVTAVGLDDDASLGGGRPSEVVAHVRLTAPPGDLARHFALHYDVIQRELLTHRALVSVRSDWDAGEMSGSPLMLGEVGYGATTLAVDRPGGSQWAGFASVLALGVRHIAEGTDHLLFLLALLLPAPLLATGGAFGARRWGAYGGVRHGAARLLRVVTAFTLGHSLTLAAAATGWVRAPSGPVEVLIAVSILVSAVHAWRPLFPGREALVAGGFGLVHGLAFATMIAGYGVDPWHTVLTVLGFNLGIELMQLAVVAATVPWLLLLARTPAYRAVRVTGAAVAGVAALAWIGERALGLPNPVGPWVEGAAAHGPVLVALLAVLALGATAWDRERRAVPPVTEHDSTGSPSFTFDHSL
ncbi:MAG TPA: HupE/UreJ family protein [Gemmatirosa sp.]